MISNKLKKLETELSKKYDSHCHYVKDGKKYGATIWLKEPFIFTEEVLGFYTWKDAIILTDGAGDGEMDYMLNDREAKMFLDYISDEKNLEFEH